MSWLMPSTERRLDPRREERVYQKEESKYPRPHHKALILFDPADDRRGSLVDRERPLSSGRGRQALATARVVHPVETLHGSEHRECHANPTAEDVRPKGRP